MALVIKQKDQIAVVGGKFFIWVTDKTGAYDAEDNTGGWGAPNKELSQSALLCHVVRKALSGDQASDPVGSQLKFDGAASNSDENYFQMEYLGDGVYSHYLVRLPVSNDGSVDLELNTINEGDFFYMDNAVYQKSGGENVLIEDYAVVVADDSLPSRHCQVVWQGDQAAKRAELYRKYRKKRRGEASEDVVFQQLVALREDIQGAEYEFKSGLTSYAQEIIEDNLDRYNIG